MNILTAPKFKNGFEVIAYQQEQIKTTMKILQALVGEDDIIEEVVIKTKSQKSYDEQELTILRREDRIVGVHYDYSLDIPNGRVEE
jgi:D-tyrosyl-tRNA(Tyr) deacylase